MSAADKSLCAGGFVTEYERARHSSTDPIPRLDLLAGPYSIPVGVHLEGPDSNQIELVQRKQPLESAEIDDFALGRHS